MISWNESIGGQVDPHIRSTDSLKRGGRIGPIRHHILRYTAIDSMANRSTPIRAEHSSVLWQRGEPRIGVDEGHSTTLAKCCSMGDTGGV